MPAAAYDENGRLVSLLAYSADQPRVESGPGGGQWTSGGETNSAAGDDQAAKDAYAAMLGMTPAQRADFLAKQSPDMLKRIGAFAALGKATDGPIAQIRNAVGDTMKSKGIDPGSVGLKAKPGKKGAAKKGGKSSGGGSKGGGGKSSGGGGSKGGGSKKSGGGSSKKSGGSSSKSSGSKSSGSKSSGSTKTPAKTTTPAKPTPPPAPPEVKPIGLPGRPGARPAPGPPSTQPVSRPAGRVGKRRRRASSR